MCPHPTVLRPRRKALASLGAAAAIVALALWMVVVAAAAAAAHAVLLDTDPGDGEPLAAPPDEVVLYYNEPVGLPTAALAVYDSEGEQVDDGDSGFGDDRSQVRVGLRDGLGDGIYTVSWRVISEDTHPIRGGFVFTVGDVAQADLAEVEAAGFFQADEGRGMEVAGAVGRAIMYVGVLLAAGGAAFLVFVYDRAPKDARLLTRIVVIGALLGALGSVVGMPIQAAHVTGAGMEAMTDAAAMDQVVTSNFGISTIVRLAGLVVLLVGVARLWAPWASAASLVGGVVALASFLLAGHTATTEPRWLVVTANFAHTLTAAVWFGGLALLGVALRRRRLDRDANGGARMVVRFSTVALVSVLILLAAGTALAWAEVRSLAALTATDYGWTLLIKVTIVLILVAVGAYNRQRLVPAIDRGAGDAWTRLSRTVRLEAVGIVAVLAVTAVLVNTVPARNFVPPEPVSAYADLGPDHQVHLVVEPAQAGENEIHMYVLDGDGRVADIADEVTLRMELPEADVAPISREPEPAGPGHYFHAGPELSMPGEWVFEVQVLVSDFERPSAEFEVAVAEMSHDAHTAAEPVEAHDDHDEMSDDDMPE